MKKINISTPQEMHQLWIDLAKKHKKILLYWDLWAGKTTLTKWFAQWLNIDTNKIHSPTYTYINIYEDKLLHMDMYRLDEFDDLVNKWILDQIQEFDNLIIERPKFIDKLWLGEFLEIRIKKINENEREIEIL
jgi:tRNA threonylcarbamoyl adenosine modification protein YjeE